MTEDRIRILTAAADVLAELHAEANVSKRILWGAFLGRLLRDLRHVIATRNGTAGHTGPI